MLKFNLTVIYLIVIIILLHFQQLYTIDFIIIQLQQVYSFCELNERNAIMLL